MVAMTPLEKLPYEVIAQILSYLPITSYYTIKQTCRPLLLVIRGIFARMSRETYLHAIQAEDRKTKHRSTPRQAMEIMIARGQPSLVIHYLTRYAAHGTLHTPPEYDIQLSQRATMRERNCFALSLHWAVYYGQTEIVRLLSHRVHIRAGRVGRTALHFAAEGNRVDMAGILVEYGAYVNAVNDDGDTPLSVAMENEAWQVADLLKGKGGMMSLGHVIDDGDEEWVKVFHDRNSDWRVLYQTVHRYFPPKCVKRVKAFRLYVGYLQARVMTSARHLSWDRKQLFRAAVHEDLRFIVSLALEEGCDVNAVIGDRGKRALHIAMDRGDLKLMELLHSRGADPNLSTNLPCEPMRNVFWHPNSALHYAYSLQSRRFIDFFEKKGYTINSKNSQGQTALYLAAWIGQHEQVRYLLSKGADVDAPDPHGKTPLYAHIEHFPNLALTHEFGPSIPANEHFTRSSKFHEPRSPYTPVIQQLIQAGASVEPRNKDGRTPLHIITQLTVAEKFPTLARYLLDLGASINAHDNEGRGVLHFVAQRENGRVLVAQHLLAYGADLGARDERGRSALHESLACKRWNQYDYQRFLVQQGIDVNAADEEGCTPLHLAAKNPTEITNAGLHIGFLLLRHGANANARDGGKCTPLHVALSQEEVELDRKLFWCKVLLENGASVNARDGTGATPLLYALRFCSMRTWGDVKLGDIVSLLLSHGADVHAKDKSGYSANDLCAAVGEETEVLIKNAAASTTSLPTRVNEKRASLLGKMRSSFSWMSPKSE